jgi:hypothetical protein
VNFEELYIQIRKGSASHRCDFYYCCCGGLSKRVEKIIQRLDADEIYQSLLKIDIQDYLREDIEEDRRQFLKHILEGADWGKPILPGEAQTNVYRHWQSQLRGNEYRPLEHIFQFEDPDLYTGRDDDFDIEVVMSEHQGQCLNREGLGVTILSTESPGEFPLIGRVFDYFSEGELEEYRWDGSHYCDNILDLVMPGSLDHLYQLEDFNMNNEQLIRKLNSVGKKAFVENYETFQSYASGQMSRESAIDTLVSLCVSNEAGANIRVGNAKQIFNAGKQKAALIIICDSLHISRITQAQAGSLLQSS